MLITIFEFIQFQLKEEIAEYKEDVEQLKEIAKKSDVKINVRESAAAKRLLKKVDSMISKLDKVMDGLEKEKKLQADSAEDRTSEESVRIDEVMNVVRKVMRYFFGLGKNIEMRSLFKIIGIYFR